MCTKTSRQIDSELFSWPCTWKPTELSDKLSRNLDSKHTICPWAWRQIQLFDKRNLVSRLTFELLIIWEPITEMSDRTSRHLNSSCTMCPWAWRIMQFCKHCACQLVSDCEISKPAQHCSLMCPLESWTPGRFQTKRPASQDSTGLRSHRETNLTQNSMTSCLSTLQKSEHLSPFSPYFYYSLRSLWPDICALFTLGGVLLRRKLHHAPGGETIQWSEDFVLKYTAGNEKTQWECIVEET